MVCLSLPPPIDKLLALHLGAGLVHQGFLRVHQAPDLSVLQTGAGFVLLRKRHGAVPAIWDWEDSLAHQDPEEWHCVWLFGRWQSSPVGSK